MKKNYSIRISTELHEEIQSLADSELRNFSNMVEYILSQYVINHKTHNDENTD